MNALLTLLQVYEGTYRPKLIIGWDIFKTAPDRFQTFDLGDGRNLNPDNYFKF